MAKDEIKEISEWIDKVKTLLDTYNERMANALADAAPPKLRHGDYGYAERSGQQDSGFVVAAQSTLAGSPKAFYDDGAGQIKVNNCKQSHVRLGNIFDDLAALSEPLKKFSRCPGQDEDDGGNVEAQFHAHVSGPHIWLEVETEGYYFEKEDVEAIIRDLRRLVATAEQEQKK